MRKLRGKSLPAALVAWLCLEHHAGTPASCPFVELAPRLDDWERRAGTNRGLQEVKWEIAAILRRSCNTPRLDDLVDSSGYDPDALEASERSFCPNEGSLSLNEPSTGNWHILANEQYRRCKFARYGLLQEHELNAVEPPVARFWHAVDELFEASLEPTVARRTARLLLLAYDAEKRTPEFYVLRRGALIRPDQSGEPTVWQLDDEGRLRAAAADHPYRAGGVETLSLDSDARGRDLAWLFDYCELRHYGCRPIYLGLTVRSATGLPTVAAVEIARSDDGHGLDEPEPEPVLTVFFHERGFELREPGGGAGESRPWELYEDSLTAEVPSIGKIDVMLASEVSASTFLPALVALQRHLGLRYPRLLRGRAADALD